MVIVEKVGGGGCVGNKMEVVLAGSPLDQYLHTLEDEELIGLFFVVVVLLFCFVVMLLLLVLYVVVIFVLSWLSF